MALTLFSLDIYSLADHGSYKDNHVAKYALNMDARNGGVGLIGNMVDGCFRIVDTVV